MCFDLHSVSRAKSQIPSSKSQANLKVSTKSYETTDNADATDDEGLMCSAVKARRQKTAERTRCRASAPLAQVADAPALQFILRPHRGDPLSVENADMFAHSKV
jgi:hypothetical protein